MIVHACFQQSELLLQCNDKVPRGPDWQTSAFLNP